ncbi:lactonase family protein [Paenibacillus sp. 19GGS1-52]|uniref:lactonase family protein n=1 Tax=Paenibacillus sp. 19GGS1-52 TaxID=2758563 RepID=UPI001EFB4AC8|nr:lactonase family protein [Paenibacillus sp. 19GGS1-52]ULO07211.1 lactonase family protein [Paenibacillus sp. 19GGS1-52]
MERYDEMLFYVGTYKPKGEKALLLCSLNLISGEIRNLAGISGIESPSYLAVNSTKSVLYAVSEQEEGEIHAFSIDARTRELSPLGSQRTEGGSPCYVSISPKDDFIFVSNYMGGNVNVFPLNGDGSLQVMSDQVRHQGSGLRQDRQEAPHPHSVIPDSSGGRILVCDLGLDQIVLYQTEEGKLIKHHEVNLPPGSGPRHLAVHPSGQWVYLINELNSTVTVFESDEQLGALGILQQINTLPESYSAGSNDTAADIHISPCGRFLYASNRGHDSIVLFHIHASTGLLEVADWQKSGGRTPRNFAIIGGVLLAANQNSGNITSFTIDADTGRLIPTGNILEIASPVCITAV